MKYDVCIIGSGAGAGPICHELVQAGFQVVVLEKGPWFRTTDFAKDELAASRRNVYTPNPKHEQHVIETQNSEGKWEAKATYDSGRNFWNGNCIGGSSNFMSGYFSRFKPTDFQLLTTYPSIPNANIANWPIQYSDLEAYYTKTETELGISGKVVPHSQQEPRSTPDFPYPPLAENKIATWLDQAATTLNYELIPIPRAILSRPKDKRKACYYSDFCGSYGCSSDAKGSSRAAFIEQAATKDNCTILPNSKVYLLEQQNQRVNKAWYYTQTGEKKSIEAHHFIVAAQAIETARLLLMSKSRKFPNGLANNSNQVGKNLVFSGGGVGGGNLYYADLSPNKAQQLSTPGVFVNRSLHQWYTINDPKFGNQPIKGGIIDFLFEHSNPISRASNQKWGDNNELLIGSALKQNIKNYFTQQRKIKFEVFVDWLPNDNCYVELDDKTTDKWGDPVARIRTAAHPHDVKISKYLAQKAEKLLHEIGAKNIYSSISSSPPPNLVAGGCRFGHNPATSVLDANCKAHEVDNLYITDGSFLPNSGSVTPTWTIYANSFRVAQHLITQLKKEKNE